MFCPHCGAQLPDGSKFCASCGQPIAAPAGAPASAPQSATPGAGAAARKMPSPKVLGIIGAVVVVLIVGLATNWFGIAKPKLPTGTYTVSYNGDTAFSLTVAKGGSTFGDDYGDNTTFVPEDPEGVKDGNVYGTISSFSVSDSSTDASNVTGYYEIPKDPNENIVGNWILVMSDPNEQRSAALVAQVKDDGTYHVAAHEIDDNDAEGFYASMKDGSFQLDDNEGMTGTWEKNDDGTYTIKIDDYSDESLTLSVSD